VKLYAPCYYKKFTCVADRCRHSCCIGWEIDVDEDTLERYRALPADCGKEILQSIDTEDCPHFRLTKGERCPHLDGRGLCKIILSLGEDFLCDICREHPRFYHVTSRAMEVGIGMSCEEASRLILTEEAYWDFCEIGDVDGENDLSEFDACALRHAIYACLSETALPYGERLKRLRKEYGVTPSRYSDSAWRELLSSLEYLDGEHRALFGCYSSAAKVSCGQEIWLERALAYFIFRHCSDACDKESFRASLGLALFFERLFASMIETQGECTLSDAVILARILSEELEYSEENTEAIKSFFLN